jgi:mannose-1-phosphate guanylyltransferase/mannose-6-phosphate isomerase
MSYKTPVVSVILGGGSGTRLWPLSRAAFPKQFLKLFGSASLFQEAIERINELKNRNYAIRKHLIVSNEDHRFIVLDQLRELKNIPAELILEPRGKNTAPALTLAALRASEKGEDPVMVVSPADHKISNSNPFLGSLINAIEIAQTSEIVLLGITPSRPEIAYGYIKKGNEHGIKGRYAISQFTEKPDIKTAHDFFVNSEYLWNSGIFVMLASTWLKAIQKFRNDIFSACVKSYSHKTTDRIDKTVLIRPDQELFMQIPSESIDYAVIEQCPKEQFPMSVVALDANWSDLGAWDAVWRVGQADEHGNVCQGDVLCLHSKNNLVHASTRLVSAIGIENLIIVETADAILVTTREYSQEVKQIISHLKAAGREEKDLHRKVRRPWGWYDTIDQGEHFKVKRIQVNPGASLSLQSHQHRAEHWIVVKGTAEITIDEKIFCLKDNESTFIPAKVKHRLKNPSTESLEIIEVQSGSYLGEDDIIRYEDIYGRN